MYEPNFSLALTFYANNGIGHMMCDNVELGKWNDFLSYMRGHTKRQKIGDQENI